MNAWLDPLLLAVAVATALPVLVVAAETLLALLPRRPAAMDAARPRIAVLVPAHDEEAVIARTLASLRPELQEGDRLVVVADNCTDRTAALARAGGAEVIERHDPERRGKGYALAFGMEFLAQAPPDVVVLVDADCEVSPGSVSVLGRRAMSARLPIQAEYTLRPTTSSPRSAISILAFLVKNVVRPRGLGRMGLPCHLTGAGMAFPFDVLRRMPLASSAIVEDMLMGIDLAIGGHPPQPCAEARVVSDSPETRQATLGQRRRWEHGHIHTLLTHAPRLVLAGLRQRRLGPIAMGVDLAVPPLSLLVLVILVATTVSAAALVAGSSPWPFAVSTGALGLLLIAVLVAWFAFGRELVRARALFAIPVYVAWKVPLYVAFLLRGPERAWVRTERGGEPSPGEPSSDTER